MRGRATTLTLAGSGTFRGYLLNAAAATFGPPSSGTLVCGGIGHTDATDKPSVTFALTPTDPAATSVTLRGSVLTVGSPMKSLGSRMLLISDS